MNHKVLYIIIVILIFLGILVGGYFWFFKTTPTLKTGTFRIGDKIFSVEIADTLRSRAQGLSGRKSINEDSGMLFVFQIPASYSFWMKDMNFPLDMVWIRSGKVIGITENVPSPTGGIFSLPTYSPPDTIDQILEINAGASKKFDLKAGDSAVLKN